MYKLKNFIATICRDSHGLDCFKNGTGSSAVASHGSSINPPNIRGRVSPNTSMEWESGCLHALIVVFPGYCYKPDAGLNTTSFWSSHALAVFIIAAAFNGLNKLPDFKKRRTSKKLLAASIILKEAFLLSHTGGNASPNTMSATTSIWIITYSFCFRTMVFTSMQMLIN